MMRLFAACTVTESLNNKIGHGWTRVHTNNESNISGSQCHFGGEEFQTNLILPEPYEFISLTASLFRYPAIPSSCSRRNGTDL